MNSNPITNQTEYDYRFLSYLLTEVFSKETLSQSAVYQLQSRKHKFHLLDGNRYSFVENLFKERTGNDKKRLKGLPAHINKRCNTLRQNLKSKK